MILAKISPLESTNILSKRDISSTQYNYATFLQIQSFDNLCYALNYFCGGFAMYLLGILLIALKGRRTRIVLMADMLKFSVSTAYSIALKNKHLHMMNQFAITTNIN